MYNESDCWFHHNGMLPPIAGRLESISHIAKKVPGLSLSPAAQSLQDLYARYASWSSALMKSVMVGESAELTKKSHNALWRWLKERLAKAEELHAEYASIVAALIPVVAAPLPEEMLQPADEDAGDDPWFRDAVSLGGSALSGRFMPFMLEDSISQSMRNCMIAEAVAVGESLKAATKSAQLCFWLSMQHKQEHNRA
jgi:hypothetical protein